MNNKQIISDMVPRNSKPKPPSPVSQPPATRLPPVTVKAVPERAAPARRPKPRSAAIREEEDEMREIRKPRRAPRKKLRWTLAIIAVILIGSFALLTIFGSATVTVTAKTETGKLSEDISSQKDTGGDIPYALMTITRDSSVTVTAATDQDVSQKASGTITITNDFSTAPYRLIKNTRFESAGGLIFKISDTAVVPGKTTAAGKDVPGIITVPIFAESPGSEYNVGIADFTIPGFKGRPEYEAFSGRSAPPLAGGFVGKEKVASVADIAAARTSLDADLRKQLLDAAKAEVPANFLSFPDATVVTFTSAYPVSKDSGVSVTEHATLQAAIFDGALLEKNIATKLGLTSPDAPGSISNAGSLTFAPKGTTFAAALQAGGPIQFNLSGNPVIKDTVDILSLQKALAGLPKAKFGDIINTFSSIDTAELKLLPAWAQNLPSNTSKIKITVSGK